MTDEWGGARNGVSDRLVVARRLGAGGLRQTALDRLAALACRILGTASAQITVVADLASTVGAAGLPDALAGDSALEHSLCARTALQGRPFVVADTQVDQTLAAFHAVSSHAAGCFLGVPVFTGDHTAVGALCVFDLAPRIWVQEDVATLEALAESAASELELFALARDLEASRARWDLAIDAAGAGTFDWDLHTGQLTWDSTLIDMFGYSDDEVFDESIEAFNARVHPEDLPAVTEALQRCIDSVGDFEAEYRIVLPGNSIRNIQARGRALGTGAETDRVLGAAWDVSATRASQDRAARIVEAMPVAYLRTDPDGRVLAVNQIAERLLHVNRLDLVGRILWQTVPEAATARLDDVVTQVLRENEPAVVELHLSDPISSWFELRVWPDGGELSVYFTDITARRAQEASAQQLALHDRAVAEALQDALLTRLPSLEHLELHARYVTAAVGDRVGGDWYDAVVQPGGSTVLVIGDVAGHDIAAAAAMGQLRSLLRAFAWQSDDSPAELMTTFDRAVSVLNPGTLATALVTQLGPPAPDGRRVLRWSTAGHPPLLVARPDGSVVRADGRPDLMLGVLPASPRHDHTMTIEPGSTILMYTDGLVERRREDIDSGIARLVAALGRHADLPVPQLVGAVVDDVLDVRDDDIVLLAVRIRRQPPREA